MQQTRNLLVFFLFAFVLIVGWHRLSTWLAGDQEQAASTPADTKDKTVAPKKSDGATHPAAKLQPLAPITLDKDVLALGGDEDSKFDLHVVLDPRGAGVRSVRLNRFKASDRYGKPEDDLLELVPAKDNTIQPAFVMSHFDPNESGSDARPLDTLSRRVWTVADKSNGTTDGRAQHSVTFQTEIANVVIRKTYTLVEGEYHIGMRIEMQRKPTDKPSEMKFRYQLAGARGLPVEGRWYTGTYRNSLIGTVDRGSLTRDLQELRQVSLRGGGDPILSQDGSFIRYAGIAVQYFASMIVVDNEQDNERILAQARPTVERAVLHGTVVKGSEKLVDRMIVSDGKFTYTVFLPPHLRAPLHEWKDGTTVAVIYYPLSLDPEGQPEKEREFGQLLAETVHVGSQAAATHALWEDDITMRVSTLPVELRPGETVVHSYLLYHGPVKPSLLGRLGGEAAVSSDLVDRYAHTLQLNTMTDYASPGALGTFARTIGWTYIVIKMTNFMHWVLSWLHWAGYGLSIILLTVIVRSCMFPVSRKQALMGLKMQALAPEMQKIRAKYKDKPQEASAAQMALFRKHGVNPLGSCWLLLLQMPIFMGLYYALQESIQFRLAPFWPTWIENLAAPDMMIRWGEAIPYISRPQDFGGFIYLGPYLNLLPIVAVALMIAQQKMFTPPPADEQQEMQQKMMTWMMVVMGVMFYKMAAGMCVYFIASSLWGFAERKLLPKAKLAGTPPTDEEEGEADKPGTDSATNVKTEASTTGISSKKRRKNKTKTGSGSTAASVTTEPKTWFGRWKQQVAEKWAKLLEEAQKKK